MKNITLIILLLWSTYGNGQDHQLIVHGGFTNANTYQQLDEADQHLYIGGLIAGISLILSKKQFDCFSPRLAGNQLHAMVNKQLEENPEDWNLGMQVHLYRVIANICPD